jgi:monoterpene epsilon-lactone hydrolase
MSWQNFVLSLILRLRVKRRATDEPDVAKTRALARDTATKIRIPAGWRIRPVTTPLPGEWIERDGGDDPGPGRTLLYLHGGGYFFCTPQTHRSITVTLAKAAEARVFVPDYRLAPEHRFPAAVEDAVAAYRGLLAAGIAAKRIVIGGDSAGGGLALATLLSLRDAGAPLPAAAVLFSPWTDLAATGASITGNDKRDCLFHGRQIARFARLYLGDTPPDHPLASPHYADLTGLPPLFIQASDSEVLMDDSTRLAEKAKAAAVPVEFRLWHGVPHAFQFFAPSLPEGRAALRDTATFMRRVMP